MAQQPKPFIGEIRMFAGNFAPAGWELCQGQLLSIAEFATLFNLIGTTYGGDGEETFALPDLQGRIPLHMGTGPTGTTYQLGEMAGVETVTLTTQQIPSHSHALQASTGRGTADDPTDRYPASTGALAFTAAAPNVSMAASSIQATGGSQPHDNLMPYLVVNFIIRTYAEYGDENVAVFPNPSEGSGEGTPYLGEIRLTSFNFAPKGWALCNGQFLPINQNQALFSLLGTNYGGNGQTTFALPNLRGRFPLGEGNGHTLGETGGAEAHTLTISEMPQHSHAVVVSTNAPDAASPAGSFLTKISGTLGYAASANTQLHPTAVTNAGGSQPHTNMPPYLALNYIIALQGHFPSQDPNDLTVADQFLAEVRLLPYTFVPTGWALCSGQILPISQNTALFALLGTTYGGDGRSTFALPDFQGRVPVGEGQLNVGNYYGLGTVGGTETVTLLQSEIPAHAHTLQASSSTATQASPAPDATLGVFGGGRRGETNAYATTATSSATSQVMLAAAGGSQPHNNMAPYLTLKFGISLRGLFPLRP